MLKPLPYRRAERLVEIFQPLRTIQKFYVCYPDYFDFCATQRSFTDLAASGTLVVRSDGNSSALMPAVQKIVASMDPAVPVSNAGTFDGLVGKSFATREVTLLVVALFSAFALILSLIGVYAVVARLVSLRTREIGIRVTLGAQVADVVRIVFGQGVKIVPMGLVLGIAVGLLAGKYLVSLLYVVTSYDPVTIGLVMAVLALAATLACLIPTLRAVAINPVTALRE